MLEYLYYFGCFFGWCKILENDSLLSMSQLWQKGRYAGKKRKEIRDFINLVFGGVNIAHPITIEEKQQNKNPSGILHRLLISSIGELMIDTDKAHNKNSNSIETSRSDIIGFAEFTKRYRNDDYFKEWFCYLKDFLADIEFNLSNTQQVLNDNYNTLIVFRVYLRIFMAYLVNKNPPALFDISPLVGLNTVRPDVLDALLEKLKNLDDIEEVKDVTHSIRKQISSSKQSAELEKKRIEIGEAAERFDSEMRKLAKERESDEKIFRDWERQGYLPGKDK